MPILQDFYGWGFLKEDFMSAQQRIRYIVYREFGLTALEAYKKAKGKA